MTEAPIIMNGAAPVAYQFHCPKCGACGGGERFALLGVAFGPQLVSCDGCGWQGPARDIAVETLPLSIGPEGLCLRGPLFNYSWSWDEIAMDLGCEPRESTTLHYLADGKIGLNINSHPLRVYARQDFAALVRRHGTKGASA